MPALVAGIHVFAASRKKVVDRRNIGEQSDAVLSNGYVRPRRLSISAM
jgi:hypothetical protein